MFTILWFLLKRNFYIIRCLWLRQKNTKSLFYYYFIQSIYMPNFHSMIRLTIFFYDHCKEGPKNPHMYSFFITFLNSFSSYKSSFLKIKLSFTTFLKLSLNATMQIDLLTFVAFIELY